MDKKPGVFPVIHRGAVDPSANNVFQEYGKMAEDARRTPNSVKNHMGFIGKILEPCTDETGELVIAENGNQPCFELQGKSFTNFAAILLMVIKVYFLDRVEYILELLIWGKRLPPKIIHVDARKLGSNQWLDNLGPNYICEKTGNLKLLIQTMSQYAPYRDEYRYSGWVLDCEDVYIMGRQQLRGSDWNIEKANVSCTHALKMLDVASHSLTIPLLSIAILSLVHSRMMALGEYFKGICCIVAPTQSFKTTVASLFFDFESGRKANINFEATMTAIVRTVGNARDSTTIVDDFKPGATRIENNSQIQKLSTIIRMCADDSGGIQKAGVQNTTFSNVAHGLVVVTAEQMQLQVQSTLARLLLLDMNRDSVDVDKITYFQNHHQEYRDFIQNFIRYIASQGVNQFCEHLVHRFLRKRNVLRKGVRSDVPIDNRTNDMFTWLWIVFEEFLNYAQTVGAISAEQLTNYAKEGRNVFLSAMEQQAERVSELNPVRQFFMGLQVLIDTKEVKIGALQARNSGYATADSREAIGFSKKGYVFLKNSAAIQSVVTYYRRHGKEFMVSESVLRKALADGGFIVPKSEKSYIHRLSINHESYQCIKFEQARFYELLRGGNKNEADFNEEFSSDWALRQNADDFLGPGTEAP